MISPRWLLTLTVVSITTFIAACTENTATNPTSEPTSVTASNSPTQHTDGAESLQDESSSAPTTQTPIPTATLTPEPTPASPPPTQLPSATPTPTRAPPTATPTLVPIATPTEAIPATPSAIPSATATQTHTATPTTTPIPTSTPTATPATTPLPADYRFSRIDSEVFGAAEGLIEVRFTIEITNQGETKGSEAAPVRFSVGEEKAELVGIVAPLDPQESYRLAFTARLPHDSPTLTFQVDGGEQLHIEQHVPTSDLEVAVIDHSAAGDGVTNLNIEVTNLGELTAETVSLRISWRRIEKDGEDTPWESTEVDVFAQHLSPAASHSRETRLELGRGTYEVIVEADTPSLEVELTNNIYTTQIIAEYVSLEIKELSTELEGYEPDGRARFEVTMLISNNGVSPSGTFRIGIECEAVHTGQCTLLNTPSIDQIEPGSSTEVVFVWIIPAAEVDARAYAGSLEDSLLWGQRNVRQFNLNVPERPEKVLILEATSELFGYWSDGTARIDLSLVLRNEGYKPIDEPHIVTITCSVDGEEVEDCGGDAEVSLNGGYGPSISVVDIRVPPGHLDIAIDYGASELELISLQVPKRGQPARALILEATSELLGYWSDGTARIDLSLALRNEGYESIDEPHTIAITCSLDGEEVEDCGSDTEEVSLNDGYGPSISVVELRVPLGHVDLAIDYGASESELISLKVPEKIVGVDPEVWECFSDIPAEDEDRVGCAAWEWESDVIEKWDQSKPIKVWATGDVRYLRIFDEALADIAPIVNLKFERVQSETQADLAMFTGVSKKEAQRIGFGDILCFQAAGCARRWWTDNSNVYRARIVVWLQDGTWDPLGLTDRLIRYITLHELVHALTNIGHRTDFGSIMDVRDGLLWSEIDSMDDALLRLLSHPLVKPGMTMAEIEELIVFSQELIDPPEPHEPSAIDLAKRAYVTLREAGSAKYSIRGSWPDPGCGYEFGWAEYEIDALQHYWANLIRFEDGSDHIYFINPQPSQIEYWTRSADNWKSTNSGEALESTGWRDSYGNPLQVLASIIYYADPNAIKLEKLRSGKIRLSVQLDQALTRNDNWLSQNTNIEILLDQETYKIEEYNVDWQWSGSNAYCSSYQLDAKDGEYGIEIEFPDEIIAESRYFK